jgi:hypothetical protein
MKSPYNLVAGLDVHNKSVVVVVLQKPQPEQDYQVGLDPPIRILPRTRVD